MEIIKFFEQFYYESESYFMLNIYSQSLLWTVLSLKVVSIYALNVKGLTPVIVSSCALQTYYVFRLFITSFKKRCFTVFAQ